MIGATQSRLNIAYDCVEPLELRQFFWLSASCNLWYMLAAGLGHSRETRQAIGDDSRPGCNMVLSPA
jgi:hypothetical protein